jgi:hypothetical protein
MEFLYASSLTQPPSLARQICDFGLARIVHTSAMSSSGHGRVQIEDEIDGKAPTNFGCPPVRDCQRISAPLDISLVLWNAKPQSLFIIVCLLYNAEDRFDAAADKARRNSMVSRAGTDSNTAVHIGGRHLESWLYTSRAIEHAGRERPGVSRPKASLSWW